MALHREHLKAAGAMTVINQLQQVYDKFIVPAGLQRVFSWEDLNLVINNPGLPWMQCGTMFIITTRDEFLSDKISGCVIIIGIWGKRAFLVRFISDEVIGNETILGSTLEFVSVLGRTICAYIWEVPSDDELQHEQDALILLDSRLTFGYNHNVRFLGDFLHICPKPPFLLHKEFCKSQIGEFVFLYSPVKKGIRTVASLEALTGTGSCDDGEEEANSEKRLFDDADYEESSQTTGDTKNSECMLSESTLRHIVKFYTSLSALPSQ